tara:strand:+ start:7 stop:528 length:522 start_codon:yes stop_codon:yes gene_type:complete
METVGSVIDKLCILEKRMQVLQNEIKEIEESPHLTHDEMFDAKKKELHKKKCITAQENRETITELKLQRGWLLKELGRIIVDVSDKKRPAMFKKHKIYDKDTRGTKSSSFIQAINDLNVCTETLWDLEDTRRGKLPDQIRLEAADKVSVYNKRRNDVIDNIDEIIHMGIYVSR